MANTQEYGLFQLLEKGLLDPNQRSVIAPTDLLVGGILVTTDMHNTATASLMRLFAVDTTNFQESVDQHGSSESQPVDEFGRTIPIKIGLGYTVGYPLLQSGNATGATYLMNKVITNKQTAELLSRMLKGDYKWVERHVQAAIFNNTMLVYHDILGNGDINVFGPANNDATTYYSDDTQNSAQDTHFLAQAAAISDAANPYPVIVAELLEHPDNDGDVLCFIPTNLVAVTEALEDFVPLPIDNGIRINDPVLELIDRLGATLPANCKVLGKTQSGAWIIQWKSLPNNYIMAICSAGKRPLKRRLIAIGDEDGFKPVATREDFPYFEEQWHRIEGYGGFNRTGAVVMQIGAGAYAVPANYTTPLR